MKKKKIILIIICITLIFCFIKFIITLGILFGKIEDYKYLKINDKNKNYVIKLLKEQEKNIFSLDEFVDLDICYQSLNKIEVIYMFPDGENYRLYCNNDIIAFTLDNSDYALSSYVGKNGRSLIRLKF